MDNDEGMSWQTADLLSADTTDVFAADTTDVLPAYTTHVLPTDKFGVGNPTFANYFGGLGPTPGMLGVGNPFSEKMFPKQRFITVWELPGIQKRMKPIKRMKRMGLAVQTLGSSRA